MILVVEYDPSIIQLIEARLTIDGHKVMVASDGKSAVEKARKEHPQLILLDIVIPNLNGYEVCKILKADPKTKDIPIIMLTVLIHIKDSEAAFEAGANDYIAKPFDMQRLMEKINKFLSR